MKNVCPHCGKLIKDGQQAFNLTENLQYQINRYINAQDDPEKKNLHQKGMEAFFNYIKDNHPLVYTSKELWEMTSVMSDANNIARTILFKFPHDKILELMKEYQQDKDDKDNESIKWYEKEKDLQDMVLRFDLMKTMADGDIDFDTILDAFDNKPVARKRICPHHGCYGQLSYWAGRYEEICLSVLGGQRISKTTTLTAMAAKFINGRGYEGIRWEGSPLDETYQTFRTDCLDEYEAGHAIVATEKTRKNAARISFRVTSDWYPKPIILTFVDLPGEFNNEKGIDDELFKEYRHYFDNVDFIWYCTDPGELRGLTKSGPYADELGLGAGRVPLSTEQICSNMNQMSGFFKNKPVAYILGKTDVQLVNKEDKKKYHLFFDKNSGSAFPLMDTLPLDAEKFFNEAKLVKDYMIANNKHLVSTFNKNFPNHCFFAMSAYGWSPKNNKQRRPPEPFRCTAPFIWMLACKGYIPVRIMKKKKFWGGYDEKRIYLNEHCDRKTRESILYNLYMQGNSFNII